jgi:hypothetical protein
VIKRILAVSAIGAVGMLGMNAIPAGASGHIGPNVNLKMKNGVLKFVPSTLNVPVKPGKKCKTTSYQFSITNKSGSTQTVLQQGNTWETFAPGEKIDSCNGGPFQWEYTVPGTSAELTVNVS